jgi:hypothetical protein
VSCCWRRLKIGIELFNCSTRQMCLIFWVAVVGDSLVRWEGCSYLGAEGNLHCHDQVKPGTRTACASHHAALPVEAIRRAPREHCTLHTPDGEVNFRAALEWNLRAKRKQEQQVLEEKGDVEWRQLACNRSPGRQKLDAWPRRCRAEPGSCWTSDPAR